MAAPLKPTTQLLLILIGITLVIWLLRGLGLLTFLPGLVIWLMLLACFTVAIINGIQSTR